MDSRTIRLSFVTAIKHSCGFRAAQESPELCAFVQLHANVSCNAIISNRARGGLHVRSRDVEIRIGLTMLRDDGKREKEESELQAPQSDSYAEAHAIRNALCVNFRVKHSSRQDAKFTRRVELRARLSETVSETSANVVALTTSCFGHLIFRGNLLPSGKWTQFGRRRKDG